MPLLNIITKNLDTNLKKEDILKYLPYIINIDINNTTMEQLPGQSELCNNIWIYSYDKEKTKKIFDK